MRLIILKHSPHDTDCSVLLNDNTDLSSVYTRLPEPNSGLTVASCVYETIYMLYIIYKSVYDANFTEVYCVRPVTSNARADTPLNSFGVVATYTCEYGFEYADNDTVKSFECGSNGWIPPPVECIGK